MYDQKIEKRITLLRAEFNLESNKPISVSRLEKHNSNKGMKLGVLHYSTIAGWFNHVIAASYLNPFTGLSITLHGLHCCYYKSMVSPLAIMRSIHSVLLATSNSAFLSYQISTSHQPPTS